jgi:hypothetical protein
MSASRQLQAATLRQRTPSVNRSRVSAGVSPLVPLAQNEETRPRARGRSNNFVPQEDAYLSRAYVNASCDPRIGNNQKGKEFWRKVGQGYIILCVGTEFEGRIRTTQQLYIRFNKHIKVDLVVFNRYYLRVMRSQPSGVPQSEYTDMAAELYREGEGKAFRFKLCVPILHEVPKYCPFYGDGRASDLQPELEAQSGTSDPDDDDDLLEDPHEILSTGEDPPLDEDDVEDNGVDTASRRASTSSSSSGNVRNTIGTVMGSRLKRPLGCKAAKAEKAKTLQAMATANAVKQMATNVASLVASYDRKNDNEVKRVKMEETRSAVAMYMGMGMMQEAQEWAAKFAEDLTIYRGPVVAAPPPPPPLAAGVNEPDAESVVQLTAAPLGSSTTTRNNRSTASTTNRSTSNTSRNRRNYNSSSSNRHSSSMNRNPASSRSNTPPPPAAAGAPPQRGHDNHPPVPDSPNLLADDSSEDTDVGYGQSRHQVSHTTTDRVIPAARPVPAARPPVAGGPPRPPVPAPLAVDGAGLRTAVPNEVRVTPGDDDTASGRRGLAATTRGVPRAAWHSNNHDWLMGSQLTAPPQAAGVDEDEEATQVGREERRVDEEFGTSESTVIIYGNG